MGSVELVEESDVVGLEVEAFEIDGGVDVDAPEREIHNRLKVCSDGIFT